MIGFFLCGIALEPFWPAPNGSDSSRTSVRWPCRTSRRDRLADGGQIASADTHSLIPSRITTWVDASAGRRPERRGDRHLHRRVDQRVRADRAGDRDDADPLRAPRAAGPGTGPAAKARSATRCPQTSGSAWMPCVRPTRIVSRCASAVVAQRRDQPVGLRQQDVAWPRPAARASAVSSRSDDVMPKWTYAAADRGAVLSAHAVRKAMTSCCVVSSISATALRRRRRRVAHRLDDVGGHRAGGGVRLQDQALDPAPQLVLVLASLQTRPISGSV